MLHGQPAALYFRQRIGPAQINRLLGKNGTGIQTLIHQMHSDFGFGQLVIKSPLVSVQALVLMGIGGVNIENTARKGLNKRRRQNAHVARQHHQIGLILLKQLGRFGIKSFALTALTRQRRYGATQGRRRFETKSIGLVAEDDGHFGQTF